MTDNGNHRGPDDLRSDNLRPASSLKDAGFWWGDKPGHMARMVKEVLKEADGIDAEREAHRDLWARVREEMRLRDADLKWARMSVDERYEI